MKVGFVGTGSMGLPMAQNILRNGHELIVHNRTKEKAEPLVQQGARWAETPAEAARQSEVIFTMLADDLAVETVTLGENGILEAMREGAVHISASTVSIKLINRLAEAHTAKGVYLLSSPVMGRPEAAAQAKLRLLLAGPEEARQRVEPLLQALGEILVCGDIPQMANAVKLGNNFLIASMIESIAEAMTMVRKHGVAPDRYLEIVSTFFGSPVYKNYGQLMQKRAWEPAGFKLRLGLKDVKLVQEAAEMVNSPIPTADIVKNHLIEGLAYGWGEQDWTAILKTVERDAGLEID